MFPSVGEIFSSNLFPVDKVDQCMNCVRSSGKRNADKAKQLSSFEKYAIVPVESIPPAIHVVEKGNGLHMVYSTHPWRILTQRLSDVFNSWEAEQFYMNRFYRPNWDEFVRKSDQFLQTGIAKCVHQKQERSTRTFRNNCCAANGEQ